MPALPSGLPSGLPSLPDVGDPAALARETAAAALGAGIGSPGPDGSISFAPPGGDAPGGGSGGAAPAAGGAGQDLDALAGKLYDRIRVRLKQELRLDRERSGYLTDLSRP
jgi:hypothetical protein